MSSPFSRQLREECGVVAVYRDGGNAPGLVHRGLLALQHRGEEGVGIAVEAADRELHYLKRRGLVSESMPKYEVKKLQGEKAIGHVRYSTVSADRSANIQPFVANTPYGRLAIAHNGNIKNAAELFDKLNGMGSLMSTSMDTELIVHLLARSGAKTFVEALRQALSQIVGSYSLVLLCDGHVYAVRDPHGIRPLCIGQRRDGWVVASETCALDTLRAKHVRDVERGELVEISDDGVSSIELLEPAALPAGCVFELVYFARPDSEVFGRGVYGARIAMGEQLAAQDAGFTDRERPDVVVPIPDSGVPAAIGYARRSGVPFERGIIRSHYIGRTFILPDQDARSHSVRLKLAAIREVVSGKRVVLVDDSIVRGNTSQQIVELVREAGAAEVLMRVASPPIGWPCHLGIDTPSFDELIFNKHQSEAEVGEAIGVDSLRYLGLDGLRAATGNGQFCFGCMTGDYPV